MSANNAKVQAVIETAILSAIDKVAINESAGFISDLFLQADPESGELQIYDDSEKLLDKIIIFDWINNSEDEETFNKRVSVPAKAALTALANKGVFDRDYFMKPLSVTLTDDDFVEIEELLFIDDDTLRVDDPLLKDLDSDLDDFLTKLLSDID
ncbi:MAG: hypothetical protein LLG05_16850 [Porphyromonadaceae bacterium]|jgi:hypothetical protein|nr:hypothetical protein [uncultured Macellibacteroides sp.]MCE5227514.1 hypothetical protein [Porphyromonadaceae bacterium]